MSQFEQLNLFSQDIVTAGKGYLALENLDFENAENYFRKNLSEFEANQRAKHGLMLCEYWKKIIRKCQLTDGEEGCDLLWSEIIQFPFDEYGKPATLKQALLNHLAKDIERIDANLFSDTSLCLGRVFMELEDYNKALTAFESLLLHHQNNSKLFVLYGDTLWRAGNKHQARKYYTKALLISPMEISSTHLLDRELERMIDDEGLYLAPIHAWLKYGMPDLEIEMVETQDLEHKNALEFYAILLQAEKMRIKGDYDEMICLRKKLKTKAPDILQTYIMHVSQKTQTGGFHTTERPDWDS